MFAGFVLVSLHTLFLHRFSAATHAPPWFAGCFNASSRLYGPGGARDLDPVACSVRCLDERYQVAALTSEGCYCGNWQHGLVASECFNTLSNRGTNEARGESKRQNILSLPVGGRQGSVALYRTEGPFLHSIRLTASSHSVQAGKTFVVEVSGNLAGCPNQPTGIVALQGRDFSQVTVEIQEMSHKGQSSHQVSILDDGSFVVSCDWILETPGKYELNVSVSNPLSTLSSTLHLSVLQPPPHSLMVSVLHGPLGVPSCVPFLPSHPDSALAEAVYLGDPVILQADVVDGLLAEFSWWFTHKEKGKHMEGVKRVCFPNSDCVNSTVKWTFETEGVYMVSVNASGASGWTHETIHVTVVRPVVSDLRVSVAERQLTSGEAVLVDVELFTTMKHLLVLNVTLNAERGSTVTKDDFSNNDGGDFSESIGNNATYMTKAENHSSKMAHQEFSDDHKNHSNMDCHGGTHLYLRSDANLHISNCSSCHLQLRLRCRPPKAPGWYHLRASVLSSSDPFPVLLSTVWPRALMVYERIRALRPSGSWESAVLTRAEFSLEAHSPSSRMGSRVIWTFSLDDAIVMSRTTEEWNINVSLTTAGCYKVTVKAFNPVSWASFCTHILAQDPVGGLALSLPNVFTTHRNQRVVFSITAGSNVTVSLLANATLLYRNSSYATGEEATVVLLFNHTGTVAVELRAENRVSSQSKSVMVHAERNRKPSPHVRVNPTWQPPTSHSPVHSLANNGEVVFSHPLKVWISAPRQAYPTNTDVTFLAVAEVADPVEFLWDFGDSTSARTTSRTATTRYHKPGRYDVAVVMSRGRTSFTSNVFPLVVQRAVKLNRLLHRASVLLNQTVTVSCRLNVGTDVSFLWSFGDGSRRLGQSTEQHVFQRTGEFRVTVTVSNLVSSASLSTHIFAVDRPCQPPPVKNMGPLKLQVRRYEVIHLGVTFETEVDCDISGGLRYTWTLYDSAGLVFPLPLIDTHRQSLILPSHLLHYDTYTAIARVQVVGSVVYSNYSVKLQVIQSPPVAFIRGGTNIFINNGNTTVVTLDGQRSHDPDSPMNPLSFSWTCKPVSSIASSCFHQDVPTSSPVLVFPAGFLKRNFDQFQFTLTVHSGERSASSETFLTLTSNVIGKVSVFCPQCQGGQLKWDQSFSVGALCEGCDTDPKYIQYTWSLYLVNASSKPVIEVPFCYTVDLTGLSAIMEGPTTPATSTENASETGAKKLNMNVTNSGTLSKNKRKKSTKAGLTEPEPSPNSSLVHLSTTGSGEEPFYHPLGEFDPPEPLYSSTEYQPLAPDNSGVLYSDHFVQSDVISEFPIDSDSSADWEFSFPLLESGDLGDRPDLDYDVPSMSAEEGDPGISAGRPTGVDGESPSPGDDPVFDPALHEDEGSNLVDSRPSVVIQEPILLDLPRDLVDRGLFESYTCTGLSSPSLSFRPFSLRPGSTYMLDVTAKSHGSFLGRTQLFLKTNPAPKDMMCQVQPTEGTELYTHFSIFCTSGKEDLVYEYSVGVADRPPRVLYQGRDFQHYFSLPSGDPRDDYKVTIYTKIRSSTYGTATKPCPVTVRVQPSFFRDNASSSHRDPDVELSESGLRNLSALVQLGNSAEVRNYISLLTGILNRLSLDTEANTHAQKRTRNVLICTMCELESREQASMADTICILRNLLQVTSQVALASARRVTLCIRVISEQFSKSSVPAWYYLDQETLNTLVVLLSHSLQAAVTGDDFTPDMSDSAGAKQAFESVSHEENTRDVVASFSGCKPESNSGAHIKRGGTIIKKQAAQLVADILQTAADLMLRYLLFHEAQEHRVTTGLVALYATYQNQTPTVISSDSTTFYMPDSLNQLLLLHHSRKTGSRPCVLSVLTELNHSPYPWARHLGRPSGPVVELSLHECGTRRKIPVRSLTQPLNIEMQQPLRKQSSVSEYVLRRNQVNYHSFNITQEHLQQAIQLSVVFTPPLNKAFPVMLLFRMFERPTPSMHHLHRTHRWESNTTRLILPPSYLSAAGIGHLALLNADFGKAARHKQLSEQVSYSLTVDSSLCLSWDGHQGAWTHHGCRTQQTGTTTAVSCSCHQLRPLTVVRQQIQSSHDTTDLDPFLSVSSDLTVLGVLVLCVCLYIPWLVACRRADAVSEANRRVHYLPDNSPCDPYLYAVTVHTGPCSAARMSAKVYIMLNGEDGVLQTKELQVPGCTLFKPNAQDTFILSAADSLGPVWGVHIWHDNSGPSPNWYLKHVEVSEVNRGQVNGRAWLFIGQCWLAARKGGGRVERTLLVCTEGIGFAKMLCLKLSDYLANYHVWMSVHTCPCPNSFTHTQRLGVSLLLLLGYTCANAAFISQTDDQLLFELGIIDVSAVSVTTGVFSVVAVLPVAAIISFLFRLREVKLMGSGVQHVKGRKTKKDFFEDALSVTDSTSELHLFWSGLQQWAQEAWRKKYQGADLLPASSTIMEDKNTDKEPVIQADQVIRKEAVEDNVAPTLPNLLLIAKGNSVDQAPQGKELNPLSESSGLHGTQKAASCGAGDGRQVVQEEEGPRGKRKEGSHDRAAWPGHGSDHHDNDRQRGGGFRPVSQWCHYLAWTLCLLLSLPCVVLSAVLGMRFTSSKVLLWTHSLFFSLMSCIFLIQPAVIFTAAVIVSFWYRRRADFHRFSSIREFETETLQLWSPSGVKQPGGTSSVPQERCSYLEKLLGARRRARYLRLVRPPAPAELRQTRGSGRRESLLRNSLRDLSVCGSMLLLMLCINSGSSFTDHYHVNKAVTKQFISRGPDNAFMSIQKQEDWWMWASTSLLNLLYKNASAAAVSHILIGEPILRKAEVSSSFQGQVSRESLVPECLRSFFTSTRPATHLQSNVLCGHLGCYLGPSATLGFGHTKSDAASRLKLLHSGGWLGGQTAAVKIQFTLFSPAPNLFTTVTMLAEQSPTGVVLPSAKVQSVRVYRTPVMWDYVVMVCQLLFLLLSLLQLCAQVYIVGQQGLMGYWRTPRNWLEVSLLAVTLVHYVYYICQSTIVLEVAELLQRHNHRGHVDISLLASWEQYVRNVRGVTLFLLTMKCVTVLRVNRTLAPAITLLTRSLSSLLWPTIPGLILMVALSCMGNLLFVQRSWGFSSLFRPLLTLLHHYWCPRAVRGLHFSRSDFFYSGLLCLFSTVAWTAVATGVVSSLVRRAKRAQSRGSVFTVAELVGYIRRRVFDFTRRRRHPSFENDMGGKTYYFEEFESLVDELLFRLNALSNSLHHTLPPKVPRYRDEDSPVVSPIKESSNTDTRDSVATQMTDETTNNRTDVSGHGETLPVSHQLSMSRSKLELEILQFWQQRGQREDSSSPNSVVAQLNSQQPGTKAKEAPKDRALQCYLKAQNYLPLPDSASLVRVWTEEDDSFLLGKRQATHTEVVVEVQVHEEPGSVQLD